MIVKTARKVLPVTDTYVDGKLTTRLDGRRMVTPLFVVLVAIGLCELSAELVALPVLALDLVVVDVLGALGFGTKDPPSALRHVLELLALLPLAPRLLARLLPLFLLLFLLLRALRVGDGVLGKERRRCDGHSDRERGPCRR